MTEDIDTEIDSLIEIVNSGDHNKIMEKGFWLSKLVTPLILPIPLIGSVAEYYEKKSRARFTRTLFNRTAELIRTIYSILEENIDHIEKKVDRLLDDPRLIDELKIISEKIIQNSLNEPIKGKRQFFNRLLSSVYQEALEGGNYEFTEIDEIAILLFQRISTGTVKYLAWIIENHEYYYELYNKAVRKQDEDAIDELYMLYGKDKLGTSPRSGQIFSLLIDREIRLEFNQARYYHEELINNGVLNRDRAARYGGTSPFIEVIFFFQNEELPDIFERIMKYSQL